jgi:uncharacterized protein
MTLLLWIALIACVIWILRGKSAAVHAAAAPPRPAVEVGEVMVACAHCGLHFPSSEAVVNGSGAVFCGEEHRRLHASR